MYNINEELALSSLSRGIVFLSLVQKICAELLPPAAILALFSFFAGCRSISKILQETEETSYLSPSGDKK